MLGRRPYRSIIFLSVLTAFFLFALISKNEADKTHPRAVDLAGSVQTGYHAILCPMDLFYDPRADHDAMSKFSIFMNVFGRDEKAKAFGCEVMSEGLPVKIEGPVYEGSDFISIHVAGLPPLFTMKSELENEPTAAPAAPAIALPPTPSSQVALPAPQTPQTSEPTNNVIEKDSGALPSSTTETQDAERSDQTGGSRTPTAPILLRQAEPAPTEKARIEGGSGTVLVNTVINTQGIPTEIKVIQSLSGDLDEAAMRAVQQYRFRPAMKDGAPVTAQINIEVGF